MTTVSHAEAIASIGPRPPGDLAGMARLAAELRQVARDLGRIPPVRIDNWESRAARDARRRISTAASTAREAAADLEGAARLLDQEIAGLTASRRRWARRYAELTGECPP
jgi:hypothetical protein